MTEDSLNVLNTSTCTEYLIIENLISIFINNNENVKRFIDCNLFLFLTPKINQTLNYNYIL